MIWQIKKFDALTVDELYAILRLRSEVFVVEQHCVFLDMDNIDQKSHHLFCSTTENEIVAYTRILAPGLHYTESSIGRVVTSPQYRKEGIGKVLMERSVLACLELYPNNNIKIGAQLYLKKFYESFGFVQCSDVYDEDGIDHIKMWRTSNFT